MKNRVSLSKGFGSWVKQRRIAMNLQQQDLAKTVGLSPSYISALEHGRRAPPSFEKSQKICEALGSTLWYSLWQLSEPSSLGSPFAPEVVLSDRYEQLLVDLRQQIDHVINDDSRERPRIARVSHSPAKEPQA